MSVMPLTDAGAPNNSNIAPVLAASLIIKNSVGVLYGVTITNTNAAAQFIQLFDSPTLPADAVVPIMSRVVPLEGDLYISFGTHGREFRTGIVICNSSTNATKTIGGADCLFDAQFK